MLTSLIWNFTYLMIVMMFIYIILFNTFLQVLPKCRLSVKTIVA
jgi:hypothetical protein